VLLCHRCEWRVRALEKSGTKGPGSSCSKLGSGITRCRYYIPVAPVVVRIPATQVDSVKPMLCGIRELDGILDGVKMGEREMVALYKRKIK
jgi:hypothetical protein